MPQSRGAEKEAGWPSLTNAYYRGEGGKKKGFKDTNSVFIKKKKKKKIKKEKTSRTATEAIQGGWDVLLSSLQGKEESQKAPAGFALLPGLGPRSHGAGGAGPEVEDHIL